MEHNRHAELDSSEALSKLVIPCGSVHPQMEFSCILPGQLHLCIEASADTGFSSASGEGGRLHEFDPRVCRFAPAL